MSVGSNEGELSERLGVAYAHNWVVQAKLIWRDLTGRDIGLDGAIEYPLSGNPPIQGLLLVQVKCSTDPFLRSGGLKFRCMPRHHLYWMLQRVPVLVCLVERTAETMIAERSYWIDYQSAVVASLPIENCIVRVTKMGPDQPVFDSQDRDSEDFRKWVELAIRRNAIIRAEQLNSVIDKLLRSGCAQDAYDLSKEIPSADEALIPLPNKIEIMLMAMKALRRAGTLADQRQEIENKIDSLLHQMPESPSNLVARRRFNFDRNYIKFVDALQAPQSPQRWTDVAGAFEEIVNSAPSDSVEDLECRITAQTEVVNCRTVRKLIAGDYADDRELVYAAQRLQEFLAQWFQKRAPSSNQRRYSARMALCRAFLSLRNARDAREQFQMLSDEFFEDESYHPGHCPVQIFHVWAWLSHIEGNSSEARLLLHCARLALAPIRPDVMFETYQELLAQMIGC